MPEARGKETMAGAKVKLAHEVHRNNFLSGLKVRDEGARTC